MARQFVKRDGANKIIGSVRWPDPDFPEEIDDQDPEYVAFLVRPRKPPTIKAPPVPTGTTIDDLRAELAALRQKIIDAGHLDE